MLIAAMSINYMRNRTSTLGRSAIKFDSSEVQAFLSKYAEKGVREEHPRVDSIITDTILLQLARRPSCCTLLQVLQGCPVITVRAAEEATGHRYGRSTITEYTMLARVTSSITNEGLQVLGLKVHAQATAVFKAYAVMVATQA